MKFMDTGQAEIYLAGASNYTQVAQKEVAEIHRQVELHKTNHEGVALLGFMIRHLVVPYRVAETNNSSAGRLKTYRNPST